VTGFPRNIRLLGDAARQVDARSTRSRQTQVGASDIGVCRRRAGYVHHRTPVSNPENVTGIAAILGTWIHKGALDTMRRQWGTLIETRVEDDVLRGHVDGIDLPNEWRVRAGLEPLDDAPDVVEVDDLKTKRDGRMVAHVRNRGPKRSELFQTHLYADLLRRGKVKPIQRQRALAEVGPLPVERVRLRYFSRAGESDDASQEYVHEQTYDPDITAEAYSWVQQVAASKTPEELPRDQDGPGLAIECDYCPFRRECWGEENGHAVQAQLIVTDADLAEVLREYDEQRTIEREAKARKDRDRLILDATRPAIYVDPERDLAFKLGWSGGGVSDPKPDVDKMIELFREAKLEVPYLPARPTARTIQLTRWQVPETPCQKPVGDPVPLVAEDGSTLVQDRPRGGWTVYSAMDGAEVATFTAGGFAKAHEDYVEPRPLCILKKGHSGDCQPPDVMHVLEVGDDRGDEQMEDDLADIAAEER
jgi:hypothetical protein